MSEPKADEQAPEKSSQTNGHAQEPHDVSLSVAAPAWAKLKQTIQSQASLPQRTYLQQPLPGSVVLPPAYAPNSTVPTFLRTLALVVFFGGGSMLTLITWIYKASRTGSRGIIRHQI